MLLLVASASFLLQGCRDFIAEDLRNKTVSVISPADSSETTIATVNFYWEETDGARYYRLQIAKPSFSGMTTLLADTNITGTTFTFVFTPGIYQWRIRAENGSTETAYITRTIFIDSTADLTGQTIILHSPVNDHATNDTSVLFRWYGLYNASSYRYLIKTYTGSFSGTQILPDQIISDTSVTINVISEGRYEWGVRGESSLSATNYVVRSIWIDYTNPGSVSLVSPAHNSTISGPSVSLSWSNATDSGSPLYDSIYVATDSTFNNIRKALYSNGTSISDTLSNGIYYWKTRAIDKAGNKSNYSVVRKFTVN